MAQGLDASAVRQVAHLARLRLEEGQVAAMADQLSNILAYVEKLKELDTQDVPPTTHALAVTNIFREDSPGPCFSSEQVLQNAPQSQDSFFRVPKVLDQDHA